MSRFLAHSSRRLVAVLALATATAVPSLVVIAGQTPAGAKTKGATPTTMSTNAVKWH